MTGFFSNRPKLLNDLDNDHLNKVLMIELTDHETALTDKTVDDGDTFISESNNNIQYFNRILNNAVYTSLINSGTFLSLPARLQLDLANLYSRIDHRNELIDCDLKLMNYELESQKVTTPQQQEGGVGGSSTTTAGSGSSSVKEITPRVVEVQSNAGLELNISSIKKEIMEYEKDIKERLKDIMDYLKGDDDDNND
jgi:hypothetical protein